MWNAYRPMAADGSYTTYTWSRAFPNGTQPQYIRPGRITSQQDGDGNITTCRQRPGPARVEDHQRHHH